MAGISKKKNGKKIQYTISYTDIFGKRHTSGYYDTKKEAEAHKKEFETPKANHDITYGFIFQQYLVRAENTLAKNTYLNYNRYYNSCLKPFDEIKYDKISSLMWQNFFDDLIKKQTAYTVQGCLMFAKAAVNYFIRHGEIEFNIFNKIEKIKVPKPDINHLTIEELKDVLECCKKCYREFYPLLFTFIGTGAREGEILALEKTDFSFKEGCITISKQFTKNELKLTPKTESSNRKIYLFDELKEVLNEHIKGLPPDYKLLFPNKNGGYISQSNFNKRVFQPILKLCGITKRIRIHDLRGSYIDMVLSSGLSVKFAQNQAGHADSKTTLNIYARNNGDMITAATNTLDSIFRKNQQKISKNFCQIYGVFMEIKGKVHCFFEQSGTFKNEFIKLDIPAEDYDIQNNFNETDHVIDLFAEIEKGYEGKASIFDDITKDDLIVAFFPCIYFSAVSQINFYLNCVNYKNLDNPDKIKQILKRSDKRKEFYDMLLKFCAVCYKKNIRMIFENPWNEQTYLKANFIKPPDVVDINRMSRGDYFVKPTAYWFFNCEPTHGESFQKDKNQKWHMKSKKSKQAGLCSEERSMISPDYARNFICDFILGKVQDLPQQRLNLEF